MPSVSFVGSVNDLGTFEGLPEAANGIPWTLDIKCDHNRTNVRNSPIVAVFRNKYIPVDMFSRYHGN